MNLIIPRLTIYQCAKQETTVIKINNRKNMTVALLLLGSLLLGHVSSDGVFRDENDDKVFEIAADCSQAVTAGIRSHHVVMEDTNSVEIKEEPGEFYVVQNEHMQQVKLQRVTLTQVTDLHFCGNYDHQTKAESTVVTPVRFTDIMFKQLHKKQRVSYHIDRFGYNVFPVITMDVDRTMAPKTYVTSGLKATWWANEDKDHVECEGDKFKVWGIVSDHIVPYASLTLEAKEEIGVLNVTTGQVYMPVGDHLQEICTIDHDKDYCGFYMPTMGNLLAERNETREECRMRRTTELPIKGTIMTLPASGQRVLHMPDQAVHLTLLGEHMYDDRCSMVLQKTKDYDFFVADAKNGIYSKPPKKINSHNYATQQVLNIKFDYMSFVENMREQKLAKIIAEELRAQKLHVMENFLQLTATVAGNRLIRKSQNGSHAIIHRQNGNNVRPMICPLKKYPLADVDHCSEELAVMDNNTVKYVTYPEGVLADNYTATTCDPNFCESYLLHSGPFVYQCPKTKVANASEVEHVQLAGTALDNYAMFTPEDTFQSRSIYGRYTAKPNYNKIMTHYTDRSWGAQARNFWPTYQTSQGGLDPRKPFDFATALNSSPFGAIGSAFSFLTGSLQELFFLGVLLIVGFMVLKKIRNKKNNGAAPINNIVHLPGQNNPV